MATLVSFAYTYIHVYITQLMIECLISYLFLISLEGMVVVLEQNPEFSGFITHVSL